MSPEELRTLGFPVEEITLKDGKIASLRFTNVATPEQQRETQDYLIENDLLTALAAPLPPPQPDWKALIYALAGNTALKAAIAKTSDQLALICLINEIKSGQPNFEFLKLHWDNVIEGLSLPLNSEYKQAFILLSEQKHLGLSLNADGSLKRLNWNGLQWSE